jgi:hypothetical protein
MFRIRRGGNVSSVTPFSTEIFVTARVCATAQARKSATSVAHVLPWRSIHLRACKGLIEIETPRLGDCSGSLGRLLYGGKGS